MCFIGGLFLCFTPPQYSRLHFIGSWRNRYSSPAGPHPPTHDPSAAPGCVPGGTKGSSSVHNNGSGGSHSGSLERAIVHVDMDCFFVSVVVRHRPDLKGVPVAVCHSQPGKRGTCHAARESPYTGSIRDLASPSATIG